MPCIHRCDILYGVATAYYAGKEAVFEIDNTDSFVTPNVDISYYVKDETLVSSVFCHSECDEINIGIYSLTGQLLLSKDYQLKSGNNVLSLNLENLTTGTYLIRFNSNGTLRNTGKFILLK